MEDVTCVVSVTVRILKNINLNDRLYYYWCLFSAIEMLWSVNEIILILSFVSFSFSFSFPFYFLFVSFFIFIKVVMVFHCRDCSLKMKRVDLCNMFMFIAHALTKTSSEYILWLIYVICSLHSKKFRAIFGKNARRC